ncbi:hypothetical protein, partial [Salinisphaera orenii]|uniref:hypothetical protein n=1 Tax=Salinisphaera orenii TaxID=856731 RepID=UPI001C831F98
KVAPGSLVSLQHALDDAERLCRRLEPKQADRGGKVRRPKRLRDVASTTLCASSLPLRTIMLFRLYLLQIRRYRL